MTRPEMTCAELRSALALESADHRLDREAVARHLARCESCARQAPELAPFLASMRAVPEERPALRLPRRVAGTGWAAAAILVVVALPWLTGPAAESSPVTEDPAPPAGRMRALPRHYSSADVLTVASVRGRVVESTLAVGSRPADRGPRRPAMSWFTP